MRSDIHKAKTMKLTSFHMGIAKRIAEGQGSTHLISQEWISQVRSRWDAYVSEHGESAPEHTSAVIGLDVGEFGSDANVACFRYGGFVERLMAWGGVDTVVAGDRATAEYRNRNVRTANVDATGVGSHVAPHMQRAGCHSYPVRVARAPTRTTEFGRCVNGHLEVGCNSHKTTSPDIGGDETECPVKAGRLAIPKKWR